MKQILTIAIAFLWLICPLTLVAQDGKLLGKVMDKESGGGIGGATVVVVGTTLAGVTNVNGNYTVVNVPPGEYAVTVSSAGYTPIMISNVRLKSGITTTQDFQLKKESSAEKVPYDQAPEPTQRVNPKYPDLATKAGIEGTVWTQVWIDESGNVTKVSVTKSDAEILNQPAIDAAMQWKFKPAKKDGKPIAVWVTIPFRFKMTTSTEVSDYTKPGAYLQVGVRPNSPYRIIRQHPYLTGQAPSSTTNWYPESAIKDGFEGIVMLDVTVSATGKVEQVVVSSAAREDLDSAAVRLARTWSFTPAQMGGMREKAIIRVPVGFHLPPTQK